MKKVEYVIELEVINRLIKVMEDIVGCTDLRIDRLSKRSCEWSNDIHWYTIYYSNEMDLITLGRHIEAVKRDILRRKAIEANRHKY